MEYRTGIILLAAGASRRLGQPKQSLRFRGTSLLQYSIGVALQSIASKVVVVLGAMTDADLQQNERLDVVINSEWEEGMASSIRQGLKSLMARAPDIQSALFMACDQPYVDKELLDKLITLQSETGKKIVASAYGDTKGIPAIFSSDLFPKLLELKGDKGARSLMRDSDDVASVPFPPGKIDIDTAADYAALNKKARMIIDSYNRVHDYLRISLTDNCNFRCFYCMPDEEYDFAPSSKLMQPREIFQLAQIFVGQGVKKIRLTGGEPLVRKDAAEIVQLLSALPVELTITTNGARLHEFSDLLKKCGVHSINISLDTLQQEKFQLITRRDNFPVVKENIDLAVAAGFRVKVNMVVMKGLNEGEINDFIEWTKETPVHIRFIEFMPFTGNHWASNKVFSYRDILETIGVKYAFDPLPPKAHDTAKGFAIPGHAGSFAVISTMTEPFCGSCNRLRLTADGKLKNCLFSSSETDLLTALRNGEEILPLIYGNIQSKAEALGGQFTPALKAIAAEEIHNRPMITIGG